MKVHSISNLNRKQKFIAYRKEYVGELLYQIHNQEPVSVGIEFSIEMNPLGDKEIKINLLQDIHYPLVPALKAIRSHIQVLEDDGALP